MPKFEEERPEVLTRERSRGIELRRCVHRSCVSMMITFGRTDGDHLGGC